MGPPDFCMDLYGFLLIVQNGTEFVPVQDHAALILVFFQPACNHFNSHADADRLVTEIRQLGSHNRSFFQFYQRDGIRSAFAESGGGVIDGSVGIHFSFPAELVLCLRFQTADRADVPGREDLRAAVRADFSGQGIALFFKSPMSRCFHIIGPFICVFRFYYREKSYQNLSDMLSSSQKALKIVTFS